MDNAADHSHALALVQAMRSLYQQHLLCDLTVTVDQPPLKEFAVHRAVLAAFSKHFRDLLQDGQLNAERIVVKEIDGPTMSELVRFMYTGTMSLNECNVLVVRMAAEALGMPIAVDQCQAFLARGVVQPTAAITQNQVAFTDNPVNDTKWCATRGTHNDDSVTKNRNKLSVNGMEIHGRGDERTVQDTDVTAVKRRRGRPSKVPCPGNSVDAKPPRLGKSVAGPDREKVFARSRGRPATVPDAGDAGDLPCNDTVVKRRRGRPPKLQRPVKTEAIRDGHGVILKRTGRPTKTSGAARDGGGLADIATAVEKESGCSAKAQTQGELGASCLPYTSVKKKRGRPAKAQDVHASAKELAVSELPVNRRRGRPPKVTCIVESGRLPNSDSPVKKGRGRPGMGQRAERTEQKSVEGTGIATTAAGSDNPSLLKHSRSPDMSRVANEKFEMCKDTVKRCNRKNATEVTTSALDRHEGVKGEHTGEVKSSLTGVSNESGRATVVVTLPTGSEEARVVKRGMKRICSPTPRTNGKAARAKKQMSSVDLLEWTGFNCETCGDHFVHYSTHRLHQKLTHGTKVKRLRTRGFQLMESAFVTRSTRESCYQDATRANSGQEVSLTQGNPVSESVSGTSVSGHLTSGEVTSTVHREVSSTSLCRNERPDVSGCLSGSSEKLDLADRDTSLAKMTRRKDHGRGMRYYCLMCPVSFALYSKLRHHAVQRHWNQKQRLGGGKPLPRSALKSLSSLRGKTPEDGSREKRRKRFLCYSCGRSYLFHKNLKKHKVQRHCTDEKLRMSLRCRHCRKVYKYTQALKAHLSLSHALTPDEMDLEFTDPQMVPLRLGRTQSSSGGNEHSFLCPICRKGFTSSHHTRLHLSCAHQLPVTNALRRKEKHTAVRTWRCTEPGCDFSGFDHAELRDHMTSQHPDVLVTCNICPYKTSVRSMMDRHLRQKHKNGKMCELCGKQYRVQAQLRVHKYAKHGIMDPKVKVFRCEEVECDYFTFQRNTLEQHMRKHQTTKPFACTICGRKVKTQGALEKHISKVHVGKRPFICDQCGASYGEESELKSHMARHSSVVRFPCPRCDYRTQDKGNLKTHLWSRHRELLNRNQKLFRCDQCEYVSDRKTRFREHALTHGGPRAHQCAQCDKSFLTRNALRCHVKWRHAEKDIKCDFCGHQTSMLHRMREHVRIMHTHTNIRPYGCGYCDFRCATRGNCRKHCANMHKGLAANVVKVCEYPEDALPGIVTVHRPGGRGRREAGSGGGDDGGGGVADQPGTVPLTVLKQAEGESGVEIHIETIIEESDAIESELRADSRHLTVSSPQVGTTDVPCEGGTSVTMAISDLPVVTEVVVAMGNSHSVPLSSNPTSTESASGTIGALNPMSLDTLYSLQLPAGVTDPSAAQGVATVFQDNSKTFLLHSGVAVQPLYAQHEVTLASRPLDGDTSQDGHESVYTEIRAVKPSHSDTASLTSDITAVSPGGTTYQTLNFDGLAVLSESK